MEAPQNQANPRLGYVVIDRDDLVDVTSYDSFPASDPPSWIATGIGSPQSDGPDDGEIGREGMTPDPHN